MKLLTLFFAVNCICFNNYGQLSKNNWLVGGTGEFDKYRNSVNSPSINEEGEFTEISISSSIGYFIIDKMALGIRPTFTSTKGKIASSTGGYSLQNFWVGPFGRYYFLSADKQYNILTDLSYQFGVYGGKDVSDGQLRTFSALAGPVIYFNSTVGLEFLLGYRYRQDKNSDVPRENMSKGFHMVVGLQIHLQK